MIDFISKNKELIFFGLATIPPICAVIGLFIKKSKQANTIQSQSENIQQGENENIQFQAGNNNQQAGRDINNHHHDAKPDRIVTRKNGVKSVERIMNDGTMVNDSTSLD